MFFSLKGILQMPILIQWSFIIYIYTDLHFSPQPKASLVELTTARYSDSSTHGWSSSLSWSGRPITSQLSNMFKTKTGSRGQPRQRRTPTGKAESQWAVDLILPKRPPQIPRLPRITSFPFDDVCVSVLSISVHPWEGTQPVRWSSEDEAAEEGVGGILPPSLPPLLHFL